MPTRRRTTKNADSPLRGTAAAVAYALIIVALTAFGFREWTQSPQGRASLLSFGLSEDRGAWAADMDAVLAAELPGYVAAVERTTPWTSADGDTVRCALLEAPARLSYWELQERLGSVLREIGGSLLWAEALAGRIPEHDPVAGQEGALRLDLGLRGRATHTLVLHPHGSEAPATQWSAEAPPPVPSDLLGPLDQPTIAIIVDDWGNGETPSTAAMLDLDIPLTLAVLPDLRFTRRFALEATSLALPDEVGGGGGTAAGVEGPAPARLARLERGCPVEVRLGRPGRPPIPKRRREVMLHLPMEPMSTEYDPGRRPVTVGMDEDAIADLLDDTLAQVPGARGVNNHMGSAATADLETMERFARVLAERDLYFVDSMTSAHSTAFEAARREGVPALKSRLFLDQRGISEGAVRDLLARLVRAARSRGRAVCICHPYPETVAALQAELPRLVREGIRFVTVSELMALQDERAAGGNGSDDRDAVGGVTAGTAAP